MIQQPASNGGDISAGSTNAPLELTDDDIDRLELPDNCRRLTIPGPGCLDFPPFPPLPLPASAPFDYGDSDSESLSPNPSADFTAQPPDEQSWPPDPERLKLAVKQCHAASVFTVRAGSIADQSPAGSPPALTPCDYGAPRTTHSSADESRSSSSTDLAPGSERPAATLDAQSSGSSIELVHAPRVAAARSPPVDLGVYLLHCADGISSPEPLSCATTDSEFEVVAAPRLRLWHGEAVLLSEPVLGGAVHLTTSRLFRLTDEDPRRQLALPLRRIAELRHDEHQPQLEVVCRDDSTFT